MDRCVNLEATLNYTNIANLPEPLVSALKYSDYDKVGDISVSTLPLPPRIVQLTKRHSDEITEDVSELIWRLIGSIGHKILERADTDNHLSEERLTMPCLGWVISGKPDLLGPDMVLSDYKFTSVWAIKDEKPDWVSQLNLYALLYRQHGFEAKAARIVAILRDWSKLKAAREKEKDYPQVGVVVREVPLWSPRDQETFLSNRVVDHQMAEKWSDDQLPMCTPDERWRKPDVWAVKKRGNKRAMSLFSDQAEAECFVADNNNGAVLEIEHRPGQDVRCLSYCAVKSLCSYGRTLGQGGSDETAP